MIIITVCLSYTSEKVQRLWIENPSKLFPNLFILKAKVTIIVLDGFADKA